MTNKNPDPEMTVRFDKWLWAARFYKTRRLATEAIAGGKVRVNGSRIKPSKKVQTNAQVIITRGLDDMELVVKSLSERRGPAKIAVTLYEETQTSVINRQKKQEQKKELGFFPVMDSGKRPNKKQRRDIIRFKTKE